eukprot:8239274-Alexandrium_andersonii.AAC.1
MFPIPRARSGELCCWLRSWICRFNTPITDHPRNRQGPGWLQATIPSRGPTYEYWFQLWMSSGRDFSKMIMTENIRRRKKTARMNSRKWLRKDSESR